jgi:hypothetical protein
MKNRRLGPTAFPGHASTGGDNQDNGRGPVRNQVDSQRRLFPHPLTASLSVLEFVTDNNGNVLCRPPFSMVPLVCWGEECSKAPHTVGLSFCRTGTELHPWVLFVAPAMGAA